MALTLYPEGVIYNYLILKQLQKQLFKENEPLHAGKNKIT